MKVLEWQRYFENQHKLNSKTVFSVAELANVSGTSAHNLNIELARLKKKGVIVRYAVGRYGLPGIVSIEELVSSLDPDAYVTAAYALYMHGLITQVPIEIICFTQRRHNRSRIRLTSMGKITFVCVKPAIYSLPQKRALALPEQALCDFVYIMRRRGVTPESQVTFRRLQDLSHSVLSALVSRYPKAVRRNLQNLFVLPLEVSACKVRS